MTPHDASPRSPDPAGQPGRDAARAVIGLEVHARLATRTKLFCGCESGSGGRPNSRICPVCTGFPGTLPYPNREAIRLALRAAFALGCAPQRVSRWTRKSYFYPDLPKGYQITQHEQPLALGGTLRFSRRDGSWCETELRGLHVEEDAGKSVHEGFGENASGIDFNRCGAPLIEIVTEPCIASPDDASRFLEELRALLRAAGVSDADMEKGSLRCDANVSLARAGGGTGERVEIKNLNSLRSLRAALEHEVERQRALLAGRGNVERETRLWDERAGITRPMRSKEEVSDYRYLVDPDLEALVLDEPLVEDAKRGLAPPPDRTEQELRDAGFRTEQARLVSLDPDAARYAEAARAAGASARELETWMLVEAAGRLARRNESWSTTALEPARLAALIAMVREERITSTQAKGLLDLALAEGGDPREIAAREGLAALTSEETLAELAAAVIAAHPAQAESYRRGKTALLGFFVGRLLEASGGAADPRRARDLLASLLGQP